MLTGFPWNDFGMVLGGNVILAQTASIWGLYGLTILSVLIFGSPALLVAEGRRKVPLVLLALLAALGLFGFFRLSAPSGDVKGVRVQSCSRTFRWRIFVRTAAIRFSSIT